MPAKGISLNILVYEESHYRLVKTPNSSSSSWCLIQVPSGFDVIDVVLVDFSTSPVICGIQITRSSRPFAKHHTFDTCPPRSKERLEKLWNVVFDHFKLDDSAEKFYVMLAPNCEGNEYKPPGGHLSDYYLSPARITTENDPSKSRKQPNHPISSRLPLKKKCCRCRIGKCTSCQCIQNNRTCDPECQCQLK